MDANREYGSKVDTHFQENGHFDTLTIHPLRGYFWTKFCLGVKLARNCKSQKGKSVFSSYSGVHFENILSHMSTHGRFFSQGVRIRWNLANFPGKMQIWIHLWQFRKWKKYTSGPRYWNVPVLVNTGTFLVFQYCLKMWYLRSLGCAGVIQKLTILEHKNGLVLSNTRVPVSGTWSILFPGRVKERGHCDHCHQFLVSAPGRGSWSITTCGWSVSDLPPYSDSSQALVRREGTQLCFG